MLRDRLITALKDRLPERALSFSTGAGAVATAPAPCRELDRVELYAEEDEITVHFPGAAHRHFSGRDARLTREEREKEIISAVVGFLDDLFADRVVVFQGGLQVLRADEPVPVHHLLRRRCLWSRFLDAKKG